MPHADRVEAKLKASLAREQVLQDELLAAQGQRDTIAVELARVSRLLNEAYSLLDARRDSRDQ